MPAKKKGNKGQKMALNEFLFSGDNSWADDDIELPTTSVQAPVRTTLADAPNRSELSRNDFAREPQQEEPFPTEPPFNAFIDNLPYNIEIEDLTAHFGALTVEEARFIPNKNRESPPHMAIITLSSVEHLSEALKMTGSIFNGRQIRVSVAKRRKQEDSRDWRGERDERDESRFSQRSRDPDFISQADTSNSWRQTASVPSQAPGNMRTDSTRGSFRGRDFDRERGERGEHGDHERGPEQLTQADLDDKWRNHKEPVSIDRFSAARFSSGGRSTGAPGVSSGDGYRPRNASNEARFDSAADRDSRWRSRDEQQAPALRRPEGSSTYERSESTNSRKPVVESAADKDNEWRRHDDPKPIAVVAPPAEHQHVTEQTAGEPGVATGAGAAPYHRQNANTNIRGSQRPISRGDRFSRNGSDNGDVPDQESGWRREGGYFRGSSQMRSGESNRGRSFRGSARDRADPDEAGSWRSAVERKPLRQNDNIVTAPAPASSVASTSEIAAPTEPGKTKDAAEPTITTATTTATTATPDAAAEEGKPAEQTQSQTQPADQGSRKQFGGEARGPRQGQSSKQNEYRYRRNEADQNDSWRSNRTVEPRPPREPREYRGAQGGKFRGDGSSRYTNRQRGGPPNQGQGQNSGPGPVPEKKEEQPHHNAEPQVDEDGWSTIPVKQKANRR